MKNRYDLKRAYAFRLGYLMLVLVIPSGIATLICIDHNSSLILRLILAIFSFTVPYLPSVVIAIADRGTFVQAILFFSGIGRRLLAKRLGITDEKSLKLMRSDSYSKELQDQVNQLLKKYALSLKEACELEKKRRGKLEEIKVSNNAFSSSEIDDAYEAKERNSIYVKGKKKAFWWPHFLAGSCLFQTWPRFEDYVALKS